MTTHHLSDGTVVRARNGRCITRLPEGVFVRACPNGDSLASARALGYGDDVRAMCEDHDLLHARLCAALGLPSHALRMAAGLEHDPHLARLEEDAVLAVTRWANAGGVTPALT